ncbi:MAG TPA: transglutaminase-like domain-containing protein [Bacteroidota bacterium]|nr:transglutaminase-like domain-containing protein [Bacteroidota bacterium]
MTTIDEKDTGEIRSLLTLLDDDDAVVYEMARIRLLEIGRTALSSLNPALFPEGTLLHERVSEVYETTVASQFREQLRSFMAKHPTIDDLEDAMILMARQRFPFLDAKSIHERLASMSAELRRRIDPQVSPVECVHAVSKYFGEELGFAGNKANYYDEQNHYLNRVLETQKGSPILLSILYMVVGKKINLPIEGIGLPGRFVVRFNYPQKPIYIDPFDRGKMLSRAECEMLIENSGRALSDDYFEPMSVARIMERVFRNLIISAEQKNDQSRAELFAGYIDIVTAKVYIG